MNHKEISFLYGSGREPIFTCFKEAESTSNAYELRSNDVLVLHGGADISPSFYGQKCSSNGHGSDVPTQRDILEWNAIQYAVENRIPIVGICRGAQMLCAADGGILIQHINHHGGNNHAIKDINGNTVVTNSCHHQMMEPSKHAELIAWSDDPTTGYDEHDKRILINVVPEIVFFPKLRALGIQGHPEWKPNYNFVEYCSNLIKSLLLRN